MSVLDDIIAAHHAPGALYRRHFHAPVSEVLTLKLCLVVGFMTLISLLPGLRLTALEANQPFVAYVLPAAYGCIVLMPILLILVGSVIGWLYRVFGVVGFGPIARRALALAFLALLPWLLLMGVVIGDETGGVRQALEVFVTVFAIVQVFIALRAGHQR